MADLDNDSSTGEAELLTRLEALLSLVFNSLEGNNLADAEAEQLPPPLSELYATIKSLLRERQGKAAYDQVTARVAELFPGRGAPHYAIGMALWVRGEFDAAIAALEESLKIAPSENVSRLLAQVYAEAGKLTQAQALITSEGADDLVNAGSVGTTYPLPQPQLNVVHDAVVNELAEILQYKTIESVIGKRFTVTSLETLEEKLTSALIGEIPYLGALATEDEEFRERFNFSVFHGALGKYGLLDLTFGVAVDSPRSADCPAAGLNLLSHLGMSSSIDDPQLPAALEEIKKDVSKRYVRIMLMDEDFSLRHSKRSYRYDVCAVGDEEEEFAAKLEELAASRGVSPEDIPWLDQIAFCFLPVYLPRSMEITDACLTNYRWVWSEKHFYL